MQSRWGWLLLSIALAETANLGLILVAWILHREKPHWREISLWIVRIQQHPWVTIVRLLYAIGLPTFAYLALGALTARGLGLQSVGGEITEIDGVLNDWAADLGWAILIAAIAWLIVKAGRAQSGKHQSILKRQEGLFSLYEALYHQAHWAFYREPFVLTLGLAAGSWMGAIVSAVEALTNPGWWADIQSPRSREAIVNYGALLVVSTLLYGLTRNLWIAILTDVTLRLSLGLKLPGQARKTQTRSPEQMIRVASTQ